MCGRYVLEIDLSARVARRSVAADLRTGSGLPRHGLR